MKYAEFIIDSHKIEFLNSLFGNERILVNSQEVSNKFSLFGTKLTFDLNSEQYIFTSSFKALGKRQLDIKLKKNGELVKDLNIDLNPNYKIHWGALIIIFGIIILQYLKG